MGISPQKPKRFSAQDLSGLNRDLAVDGRESGEEAQPPEPEDGKDREGEEDSGAAGDDGKEPSDDESEDQPPRESEPADSQDAEDETAETVDSPGPSPAEEEPSLSDSPLDASDDVGSLESAFADAADEPPVSSPAILTQTSVPVTAAVPVTSTLTEVTQTWQEPFNDSDISQLPAANSITLTGFHISTAVDTGDYLNANNSRQYDTNTQATSADGLVSETPAAQNDTFSDLSFSMNAYDPEAAYAMPGDTGTSFTRAVSLLGALRSFPMNVVSDPRGEFVIYDVKGSFTQEKIYVYRELGFLGAPCSATLPADGISGYFGPALGYEDLADIRKDYGMTGMFTEVNWYNGKALGCMRFSETYDTYYQNPDSYPSSREGDLFFFADVDRANRCLTNVRILGPRGPADEYVPSDPVAWIEGTGTGRFYGSAYQGFGLAGVGDDYDIQSGMTDGATIGTSWVVAAGFRQIEEGVDETSPRGTSNLRGFIVGIAEDMSAPETNRRIFMNEDPGDFQLSLNRDAGTVSGIISADDVTAPSERSLDFIEVGSSHGSAYVLDDNFIALLDDTGDDCVTSSLATGGLKTRANYLVTDDPDRQLSEYFTWGYWEIAYTDPLSGADYHVHAPGSMWIAGRLTPWAVLQDLVTGGFVGRYTGGAHGVMIDDASMISRLHNGSTDVTVDFSSSSVSGSISFDEVQLNLANGSVTTAESRFSAGIAGAAGSVRGAFFGSNAEAVGGNFHADMSGIRYIGIFGGNR